MSYSLVEACGMNLPWIMYQDLVLGKKVRQSSFKVNIFWIHERVDLPYVFRRDGQKLTIRQHLSPYFSKKVFAVFTLDDPKPSIVEGTRFLFAALRFPIKWCINRIRKRR
jgi:predicted ATP-grasp superfamily ATP-dependent carboligase